MSYTYESNVERILSNIATVKMNTKARSADVHIRVSKEEKELWAKSAARYGVGVSDFIRTILNDSDFVFAD